MCHTEVCDTAGDDFVAVFLFCANNYNADPGHVILSGAAAMDVAVAATCPAGYEVALGFTLQLSTAASSALADNETNVVSCTELNWRSCNSGAAGCGTLTCSGTSVRALHRAMVLCVSPAVMSRSLQQRLWNTPWLNSPSPLSTQAVVSVGSSLSDTSWLLVRRCHCCCCCCCYAACCSCCCYIINLI